MQLFHLGMRIDFQKGWGVMMQCSKSNSQKRDMLKSNSILELLGKLLGFPRWGEGFIQIWSFKNDSEVRVCMASFYISKG